MCCLVNKLFEMKHLHGIEQITVVKNTNPKLLHLDRVLLSCQGLPKLNEKAAAKQMSLVGVKVLSIVTVKEFV